MAGTARRQRTTQPREPRFEAANHPSAPTLPDGVRLTRIRDNGNFFVRGILFHVSRTLFGTLANLVEAESSMMVFDDQGTLLIEHQWPAPGTKYADSALPRGPRGPRRPR
ncbi:hypothetical protein [Rhodoglobus aureus]|uniref:hypothetical protein n=1 Tax=Rhodoglobus aureus TaxID=191497 RepID=UPI0031D4F97C